MQEACNRTMVVHPFGFVASGDPAWRPGPTWHVTGAPVTTCKKPHRHLRQCRVFSTAEPVQRFEATPRVTQQCQLSATITGQSAAGIGTYDQKRAGSNCSNRRAEAAVQSPPDSHPLLKR
jgi:hypothetical protein